LITISVSLWSRDCGHQIEPDPAEMAAQYGAETTVPDRRKRLVCFPPRRPAGGEWDGTPRSPPLGAVNDQLTGRAYYQLGLGLLPHSRAQQTSALASAQRRFSGRPISHHRVRMTSIASSEAIAVTPEKICMNAGVAVALFESNHGTHWRLIVVDQMAQIGRLSIA
jgi:hypothetical protein